MEFKMTFVKCQGYMIPGVFFENGFSIWILKWDENPTASKYVTEVWLFYPDGKRVCYTDPKNEIEFFKKYHSFDEVIGADIKIVENKKEIKINVNDILFIEIKKGLSLMYRIVNLLLSEKNKVIGKTETGKATENIPERIVKIIDATVKLKSESFGKMEKINKEVFVGDGKSSKKPIICHCTLKLES